MEHQLIIKLAQDGDSLFRGYGEGFQIERFTARQGINHFFTNNSEI